MAIGRLVALSALFVAGAFAGAPTTTIQDTLYKADGTPMNATAVITWNSFESSGTTQIGLQSLTVPIVNGSFYVQLVSNVGATPAAPYTVTYTSDGLFQYQETWMVAVSATPLRVRDVRVSSTTSPPANGGGTGPGPLTSSGPFPESSVTGLVQDLAARPVKGAGFGTNRVAIVDQNGAVNTVIGNLTDCVLVNGTSGPCFDPSQMPGFADGETPVGVVDGANSSFGLAGTPVPAASLAVFRNGMAQKQGIDYTLTGSVVKFPAGSIPQPGDTILAWYRTPPASQLAPLTGPPVQPGINNGILTFPTSLAQVLCSAPGTQTQPNTNALTILGTCTVPATYLRSGDRVEIRFLLSHTGASSGFNFQVKWGATMIVQRTAGLSDAMIAGHADGGVTTGVQFATDSYGSVLVSLPGFVNAPDSLASNLTISFQAGTSNAGADILSLVNYTVIRYPAVSNP